MRVIGKKKNVVEILQKLFIFLNFSFCFFDIEFLNSKKIILLYI